MTEYTHTNAVFTIKYFKLIATIRFCLSQFSDILCEWCRSKRKTEEEKQFPEEDKQFPEKQKEKQFPEEWSKVLQIVKRHFNSQRCKYPAEYFIKYIVRQHGIQSFNQLKTCEEPSFEWIMPDHLKSKEENVSKFMHIII